MWLYVEYEPISAFGLRPSNTTSNGGKSLICPTPYAIKMAILDRLIRLEGLENTRTYFSWVRDLDFWVQVPLSVAVNRTFQKVQRNWKAPRHDKDEDSGWTSTISQREYCFYAGTFTLAMSLESSEPLSDVLLKIMPTINYFGRRGSFMQLVKIQEGEKPSIEYGFVDICHAPERLAIGFLQRMDDMRRDARLEDVAAIPLEESKIKPEKDGGRIYHNVIFPYQIAHHGFNHTVYERRR